MLALCVSNGVLYSSASDNKICVWDTKTFRLLESYTAHNNPVCTLTANQDLLFSGSLKVINVSFHWSVFIGELSLVSFVAAQCDV